GGTADRNRSHWSTSKTPSYTKSVSWQHHQQWGKQYVRFNVNLKNQDTNNSSFSYGDNRFEKSQGSNWTFQE
ncbi:hypothetical protein SNA81_13860, partial [Escherichia coli]|nr:hypothetical protein [Escherichia coli]MDZ9939735.1 hypothetical protein [Escherichia coli]MEA0023926.1 hypothetical protein [Escherichia coli]MEA0550039.1 hypothetical protein [Escherichia coli]